MSNPIIERVSAGILADLRRQAEHSGSMVDHEGAVVQVDGSFDLASVAIAAIAAMSEPTSRMLLAGTACWPEVPGGVIPSDIRAAYMNMIEAAIVEGE